MTYGTKDQMNVHSNMQSGMRTYMPPQNALYNTSVNLSHQPDHEDVRKVGGEFRKRMRKSAIICTSVMVSLLAIILVLNLLQPPEEYDDYGLTVVSGEQIQNEESYQASLEERLREESTNRIVHRVLELGMTVLRSAEQETARIQAELAALEASEEAVRAGEEGAGATEEAIERERGYRIVEEAESESGGFGVSRIRGVLENTSGRTLNYAIVTFTIFDNDGNQIETARDIIENWQDGATWRYEALISRSFVDDEFKFDPAPTVEISSW